MRLFLPGESLSYPFGGLVHLIRIFFRNRPIPLRKWPRAILYLLNSLARSPFYMYHRLFQTRRIQQHLIEKTPLFIIGHYRSGTSYLNRLLTANPSWTGPRDWDLILPFQCAPLKHLIQTGIDRFGIQHPNYNAYTINLDDPTEDEAYLVSANAPWATYWGYLFPKHYDRYYEEAVFFKDDAQRARWREAYVYFVKFLSYRNDGRRLILKSPPNTARIGVLLEAFPRAKFVYLYRNPYDVFYSMRKLWEKEIDLFSLQILSPIEKDAITFDLYRRLLTRYEREKRQIPARHLIEVRYEDLIAEPERTLRTILCHLGLTHEADLSNILQRIRQDASYSARTYRYNRETLDEIDKNWGAFIEKWGYDRPDTS